MIRVRRFAAVLWVYFLAPVDASFDSGTKWKNGGFDSFGKQTEWYSKLECISSCLQNETYIGACQDQSMCKCFTASSPFNKNLTYMQHIYFDDVRPNRTLLSISTKYVDVGTDIEVFTQLRYKNDGKSSIHTYCTDTLLAPKNISYRCSFQNVKDSYTRYTHKIPYTFYSYYLVEEVYAEEEANEVINDAKYFIKISDFGVTNNSTHWIVQQISLPLITEVMFLPFNIMRPKRSCTGILREHSSGSGSIRYISVSMSGHACNCDLENVSFHFKQRFVTLHSRSFHRGSPLSTEESIENDDELHFYFHRVHVYIPVGFTLSFALKPTEIGHRQLVSLLTLCFTEFQDGVPQKKCIFREYRFSLFRQYPARGSFIHSPRPYKHNVSLISSQRIRNNSYYCSQRSLNLSCIRANFKTHVELEALPRALTLVLAIDNTTNEIYGETNRGGKGVYDPNTKRFYSIPTSQWEKVRDGLIHAKIFTREELHANQTPSFTVNGVAQQCCNGTVCTCDVDYYGPYDKAYYVALWNREEPCKNKVGKTRASSMASCDRIKRYCKEVAKGEYYVGNRVENCRM